MAYTAKTNDGSERELEEKRNSINNTENVRNAADIAIASGEPHAAAVGGAIKAADMATNGKASEIVGNGLNKINQNVPGGKAFQENLNKVNESGVGDKLGTAARVYAGTSSNPAPGSMKNKTTNNRNESYNNNSSTDEGEGSASGQSFTVKAVKLGLLLFFPLLFLLIIILSCGMMFSNFVDGLGAGFLSDEELGGLVSVDIGEKESKEFYERIHEVKLEYSQKNKDFESIIVISTFRTLNHENNSITYRKMSKRKIREIVDYSFDENFVYNEEIFYENLKDHLLRKYFPFSRLEKREEMAKEIIDYIEDYKQFVGISDESCLPANSCAYQVNGFYDPKSKSNFYLKNALEFRNLKVRLMQTGVVQGHDFGGTFGKPMEKESLIPFEEYIMGVTYLEMDDNQPEEALKAHMVAARSYALFTLTSKEDWRNIKKDKDGNYILQITNSSYDQRFCNPSLGCSTKDVAFDQIHSGFGYGNIVKKPLPSNSKMHSINSKVLGEVLVNQESNIVNTKYNTKMKNKFVELANKGYDYKQILLEVYNNSGNDNFSVDKNYCTTTGTSGCESGSLSSGPYANWKQYTGGWENIVIGKSGKTIKQIGCAATSTAILIAKSNAQTKVNLNPGTFVETLNKNNGFGTNGCLGCIKWGSASVVAPNFRLVGAVDVHKYSISQKFNTLKKLLDSGYYVTAEVMGDTGEHWVAIDGISNNNIIMMDPGSTNTNLWKTYPPINTSRYVYFRVV